MFKKLLLFSALAFLFSAQIMAAPGEGTATIEPIVVLPAETGVYVGITYTAGATAYSSGELVIIIPAGWTAPSLTGSNAGYVSAVASEGDDLVIAVENQHVTITVDALTASSGTIEFYYGSTDEGGAGATAGSAGTAEFTINSAPEGGTPSGIGSQPEIEVVAATPTITPTITQTITQTATPTHTPIVGDYTIDTQAYGIRELIIIGKVKVTHINIWTGQGIHVDSDSLTATVWVYDASATTDVSLNTAAAFSQANFRYPISLEGSGITMVPFGYTDPHTGKLHYPIFDEGVVIYYDGTGVFKATIGLNIDPNNDYND